MHGDATNTRGDHCPQRHPGMTGPTRSRRRVPTPEFRLWPNGPGPSVVPVGMPQQSHAVAVMCLTRVSFSSLFPPFPSVQIVSGPSFFHFSLSICSRGWNQRREGAAAQYTRCHLLWVPRSDRGRPARNGLPKTGGRDARGPDTISALGWCKAHLRSLRVCRRDRGVWRCAKLCERLSCR